MSRHSYTDINNNIYSIKEVGLSFIVKVPKSKYSIEKFENNIKAKPFSVRSYKTFSPLVIKTSPHTS